MNDAGDLFHVVETSEKYTALFHFNSEKYLHPNTLVIYDKRTGKGTSVSAPRFKSEEMIHGVKSEVAPEQAGAKPIFIRSSGIKKSNLQKPRIIYTIPPNNKEVSTRLDVKKLPYVGIVGAPISTSPNGYVVVQVSNGNFYERQVLDVENGCFYDYGRYAGRY